MDMAVEIADLKRRESVSEHRIQDLESEVKDIRQLTTAVVQVNDKVDRMGRDMEEIKGDVKGITSRPSKLWDYLVSGIIGTGTAFLVTVILRSVLIK